MCDAEGPLVRDARGLFSGTLQAACETKTEKAIKMEKEAISLITEITPDNALLVSNLYSNLGGLYKQAGKLELAQQSMEHGIQILEQFDIILGYVQRQSLNIIVV